MIKGLVSVVVPVHNRPLALREAVESVRTQTYRDWEILIVDDGSTDDTGRVADELAGADPERISVLHQSNGGPGSAREAGRLKARGEFLQYLDSDDLLYPEKLELQVGALRAAPECGVSYGWTRERFADGSLSPGPTKGTGERVETMFPSFLRWRWWDTPNPLYRAVVCAAAGPWSDLRQEEDWEYDCRVAGLGTRLAHVPTYVCEVRDLGDGRLSQGMASDAGRQRERASAHAAILAHAEKGGVRRETAEMAHFARELFLLSRQCGAVGLAEESARLFDLARRASTPERARSWMFRCYRLAAEVLGWSLAGRLSSLADRMRRAE